MLRVSPRMSRKTGRAPRSTKALAVETKVRSGQDHLIARTNLEEERRHFQRMRTGRGEECPRHA